MTTIAETFRGVCPGCRLLTSMRLTEATDNVATWTGICPKGHNVELTLKRASGTAIKKAGPSPAIGKTKLARHRAVGSLA